ncbi:hypothetical protein MARINON1_51852 [Marinobacter salarius]|nr:hypothetical protein MBHK15_110891 [Marinobacter salarius]VXC00554.1 hypothetical protein MARINON1_51852 [Marinobacter salarius]
MLPSSVHGRIHSVSREGLPGWCPSAEHHKPRIHKRRPRIKMAILTMIMSLTPVSTKTTV